MTVFTHIDHSAGAAKVDKALRPTVLLIFGNPTAGMPLLQSPAEDCHRSAHESAGLGGQRRAGMV